MTEAGRPFDEVLKEAQTAGYAEADPTFDVQGIDAAHTLASLMNLAFGTPVNFKDVYVEGNTRIAPMDIAYATEFGYTIKLLAIAKLHSETQGARAPAELEARVHPTMIASESPIARVDGVYNAIQVTGDAVGDVMLYGKGAGRFPTASAVVRGVVDIGRKHQKGTVRAVAPCGIKLE